MKNIYKPRTAFKDFINYLHGNVLDFEQMEKNGHLEMYHKAMQFVGEVAGNIAYSPFYKEDIELLMAVERKVMSCQELADITGVSVRSVAPRLNKLVNLAYVYSFREKKNVYYNITPFGREKLEEYINDPQSPLYV